MARKPNLLFIFTDQQRSDTLSCYGNDQVEAPTLNALARESFLFQHPYVTVPICTPDRSTLMTGLYPHTNGCLGNNIPLSSDIPTLAELISPDYRRAYMGKWHLGNEVIGQHGFEQWVSIEDQYRDYYQKDEYLDTLSDYHHHLIRNGFTPDKDSKGARVFSRPKAAKLPEEFTKATYLGQQASQFIRENKDNPFALYINFLEPHNPYTGPFNDMYPPEGLQTGPQFMEYPEPNASNHHRNRADKYKSGSVEGISLDTETGWRKVRAQYMALVTLVDKAVKEILSALDDSGAADNTIVVFTSDHGDQMGDHHMYAKSVFYEDSIKVPLMMRVPWLSDHHREIPGRISQIDLVPTLLDLLGESIPDNLQGESRVPVLKNEADLKTNDAFFEWNESGNIWRSVVSCEGWKLNLSTTDQCEFYDLNTDPYEQNNSFDDPDRKADIRSLADRIKRWQKHTDDDTPLPTV